MFKRENLHFVEYVSVGVAILGIIILTSPDSIFWSLQSNHLQDYPYYKFGVLIALVGSLSSALAHIMMQKIGTHIDYQASTLYFGLFLISGGVFATTYQNHSLQVLDMQRVILITMFGLFGWIAHVSTCKAV
jgi:drug/metabolite transporter (DMT)-like permease